jgi:hypothetical protein
MSHSECLAKSNGDDVKEKKMADNKSTEVIQLAL